MAFKSLISRVRCAEVTTVWLNVRHVQAHRVWCCAVLQRAGDCTNLPGAGSDGVWHNELVLVSCLSRQNLLYYRWHQQDLQHSLVDILVEKEWRKVLTASSTAVMYSLPDAEGW